MTAGIVLLGAGPCAAAAAQALRDGGYPGPLRLVGGEARLPYERPPLSKEYLAGSLDAQALLVKPADWYREQAIDFIGATRCERLDPVARTLALSDGSVLDYEQALIATGGTPRRLAALDGPRTLYLRSVEDADAISGYLAPGARLVVVGGGFIGAEVAATARRRGAEVTIIEPLAAPMQRVLGERIGNLLAGIHRDRGVRLELQSTVTAVRHGAQGVALETSRGVALDCDAVVVGVGLQPEVGFLRGSALAIDDGVDVDACCRTTAPGLYAAGDVARHHHPLFGRHLRVEHHDNALQQGAAAARNMLGADEPYAAVHWVWSDQYDHNIQFAGCALDCDEIVMRGSPEERSFCVFYLAAGVLRAVLGLDRGRDVVAARRLIGQQPRVDRARLADTSLRIRDAVAA